MTAPMRAQARGMMSWLVSVSGYTAVIETPS
jgi:hypothetical protein